MDEQVPSPSDNDAPATVNVSPEDSAVLELKSVTRNANGVPETGVVGVPLIRPPVMRLSPPGKVPEMSAHVYGAIPPLAFN